MLTLLYRSDAVSLLPFSALADICVRSSAKNRRLGITGFLIEHEGTFLQVLEGEAEAVNELFHRISHDERHCNMAVLGRWERKGRSFGFWAMNFGPLDTPTFWQAVFGSPVRTEEFRRRSHDADFALDVLARAYMHACIAADVDAATRDLVRGNIPCFEAA